MYRIHLIVPLIAAAAWLLPVGSPSGAATIEVDSVLLASIEEVEVPAQEAGALDRVAVREGDTVTEGELLAQVDDQDARLELARAEIELNNARRNAENDIKVRVAEKAAQVAAAELKRALDSQQRYPKSVSETEVDRLRLAAEHATLQVEQSEYDFETAQLALKVSENALARAKRQIERRKIVSPTAGRVVQIFRHRGEWVEPGQPVARVLRIDRLKAVGFLDATQVTEGLAGRGVKLRVVLSDQDRVEFPGRITFVHSEVNPVNGQVDFWAEVENRDLLLRPGLKASLAIDDADKEPSSKEQP